MFKTKMYIVSCLILSLATKAQSDTALVWTWVKGERFPGFSQHYGTKGQESSDNQPPARRAGVSWTDTSGNLWLFGGLQSPAVTLNDLWRFNTGNQQWTWISGDSIPNQAGIYGTLGEASIHNKPSARYATVGWVTPDNQLWLFGGDYTYSQTNYGMLGDLWKYDISTGMWTWVNGLAQPNAHAVFGTRGVSSPTNYPGAVSLANAWTDQQGRFWLFGGFAFRETGTVASESNKLWRYEPQTNQWTWMKGDANSIRENYGIQHVQAPANNPGGRLKATTWTDRFGNLWLFGGAFTQGRQMNDLWKYDIGSNNWVWEKGLPPPDLITNYWPAVYGIRDSAQDTNNPGGRQGGLGWTDGNDRLWLFGGLGTVTEHPLGDLNDLWSYDMNSGMWTWINGDSMINAPGHYGVQGIADTLTHPPGREQGFSWKDKQGNNWLFGGSYFLNDLWKINSSVYAGAMHVHLYGERNGQDVLINWDTDHEINTLFFQLERSADRIRFDSLVRVAAAGTSTTLRNYEYLDTGALTTINYYRLSVGFLNGTQYYSDTIEVNLHDPLLTELPFPNPVHDYVRIPYVSQKGMLLIMIYDAAGKLLIQEKVDTSTGEFYSIDLRHLPAGTYFIRQQQEGRSRVSKLVKG